MDYRKTIRIAYVEDQLAMRESVADYLAAKGITTAMHTDNGNELLSYLQHTVPPPTLCILDISMPVIDGLTVLRTIRRTFGKSMPCLMYSMHSSQQTIYKALQLGANGYLTKNSKLDELHDAIISIVNTGFAYTKDADEATFMKMMERQIRVPELTDREREFITYSSTHHSYVEIAELMNISKKTMEGYTEKIYRKLNVKTRGQLIVEAIRLGIINL